jgi:hypothetical protein
VKSPYRKENPRAYRDQYDAQIAANEPAIVWRKKRNGVFVHVSVHDPHPDSGHNASKDTCIRGHEYTPENTIVKREGWRQCRTCKNDGRKPLTPEQKQRAAELKRQRRQLRQERSAA